MSDETSKTRRVTLRKEIAGLIWLALGLFLLLCQVSFNQGDPSWNTSIRPDKISNLGGVVGAYLADILFQTFGLPALLLPLACFLVAWRLLRMREVRFRLQRTLAFFALLLSLAGLLALRFKQIPLFVKLNLVKGYAHLSGPADLPRNIIFHVFLVPFAPYRLYQRHNPAQHGQAEQREQDDVR